jgi:C1A family cysteine protease
MRKDSRYGWRRDIPDFRDLKFSAPKSVHLPPMIDLRLHCPPIYDQGILGSCTAQALAFLCQFNLAKFKHQDQSIPSRLFIYFNERVLEKSVGEDSGAQIRSGIKTLKKEGFCSENSWPYDITRFKNKPHSKCYDEALTNQIEQYSRVGQTLGELKTAIASGFPITFGFTVYDHFESSEVAKTGVLNYPQQNEHAQGGHAVSIVGYDDSTQRFLVRNSWGNDWGNRGYFTMPYSYVLDRNLADDFWVVKWVT